MIYALLIIAIIAVVMIPRRPKANLQHKLWNQVFDQPDQFTKIEWKK